MRVKIRRGDSFELYSQLFTVSAELIADANEKLNSSDLKESQEVVIPGYESETYKVRQTDTLWKLAKYKSLPVDALILLNQEKAESGLNAGESINLPRRINSFTINGKQKYKSDVLTRHISRLQEIFPFIKVRQIGESVLGKPIQEIKVGKGKLKVHINASFHANEWITTAILMRLLNHYLLLLANGQSIMGIPASQLYSKAELTIVPMVNPDGVDLVLSGPPDNLSQELIELNGGKTDFTDWKANIRGIDLNNQFPANWEIEKERKIPKKPASRDYPGNRPLSEPEAIAMAELANSTHIDRLLCFHTQGEEFYWGYEGKEPSEAEQLAREFTELSGYESIRYIDSHAGYKDWFIQQFEKPGFTIELGNGVNPLPISQFDSIYKKVKGIFFSSLYL